MPKVPGRSQPNRPVEPPPLSIPPQPAAVQFRPHAWRILALWTLAVLAYANSFRAGMTVDNGIIILQDKRIQAATSQNLGLIFSQEYWYGNSSTNLYRPLTTLTYLLNYSILGNRENPWAYHAVNLGIHLINILLVYLLGLLILRRGALAMILAALWGLHPALTECVTNIVGRADLLAGFGVLAALVCHAQSRGSTGRKRFAWLAGIAIATAIGMFSKESAIVVLAVLPLYDWLFGDGRFRPRWANYAALLPGIVAYFYLRGMMLAHAPLVIMPFVDNPLTGAGFWSARLTAVKVIGKLFLLCLWPAALSCDYSYNQIPLFAGNFSWPDLQALAALLGCLAAAVVAVHYRRRAPAVAFFIAFWFIALAPTANIAMLIGTIMAERFLYLPLIGFAGCLTLAIACIADVAHALLRAARALLPAWSPARPGTPTGVSAPGAVLRQHTVIAATAAICLAYCVRTAIRNNDWHDQISLWGSAAQTTPGSFKTHLSYAVSLAAAGSHLDTSAREADRAIAILSTLPDDRNTALGYAQAGFCYRTKGAADRSRAQYWYAKARDALVEGVKFDRINVAQARELNLAAGHGRFSGGQVKLYMELGRVDLLLHQPKDAAAAFADGRMIDSTPGYAEGVSQAYRDAGDNNGAAIALLEALVRDPDARALAPELVKVYRDLFPDSCAVGQNGGSYSINMDCPLVHGHLCTASLNVARDLQAHGEAAKASAIAGTAISEFACPVAMFQ